MNKVTNNISSNIVSIFDSYKDVILILSILGIFLYFLYRYNRKVKKNNNINKNDKTIGIDFDRKINIEND